MMGMECAVTAANKAMAFTLIVLAAGYLIVIKGDKEKGFLRALGLVTGFFIMVMSFFMVMMFSAVMSYPKETRGLRRPPMLKHAMPMHKMDNPVK